MGEAEEPAPPAAVPQNPIKIFISGNCGNKEISNAQHRITMILKSLGIAIELCDISAPGMEEQRDFMRANATKKEGQRNVLPPQVFNGEKYCGDYETFDVANEDDELEEFLGLPRKHPKVEPGKEEDAPKEGEEPKPAAEGEAPAAPAEGEAAPAEGEAAPAEGEAPAAEAPAEEAAPAES